MPIAIETRALRKVYPAPPARKRGGGRPSTFAPRTAAPPAGIRVAGGGIAAHPDGPAVGVRSLQKWWEAAVEGLTLEQAAAKYPELKKSVGKFGKAK